ncbi:MAG TPA: hypothetical protein VH701_22690 [Vicinamibacterales bacterium]
MTAGRAQRVAPLTAAALIAQQVGANALRDGLFLSLFPVETLPYFMAGTALLAIPAAQFSGHVLARRGPVTAVPLILGSSALLFLVEWILLGWNPRAAAVLLYVHSTVLGAIVISAFWSLLNERFDPHSAKPLMARVAAAATLGGLAGGVAAERVAALLPRGALLLILALVGGLCVAGVRAVSKGAPSRRAVVETTPDRANAWVAIRRQPLVRDLALVVGTAAVLAALVDYLLKAEAVAYFGRGEGLVRFFGLFYAGTGLAAVVIQSTAGKHLLARLGLGGSVASHPIVVGALGLLGFVVPTPWRGILPRGFDVAVRNSVFRAGYELLYTPLPDETKRAVKSLVDVAIDCAGKGAGAALILVLVGLAPLHPFLAVNLAVVVLAGAEFLIARRLRRGYVRALEGGLQRQSEDLEPAAQYSLADFTVVGSMAGLDRAAVQRALGSPGVSRNAASSTDPVVAAIAELRSGDLVRIRKTLAELPADPLLVGALIPVLARTEVMRPVVSALASFGARAAGEMVSALLDPDTPDVVRRRLPLALKACPSPIARDGLLACLDDGDFELRLRCSRALLALTDDHPELLTAFPTALAAVARELRGGGEAHLVRELVFNLLALALDREPVRIAARSFAIDDAFVRGTALEYLETVLPSDLFSALQPLLAVTGPTSARRRSAAEVREDLIRAGTTMVISREELQRQLDATTRDES